MKKKKIPEAAEELEGKKKSPAAAAERPRRPEVDGAAVRGARSGRGPAGRRDGRGPGTAGRRRRGRQCRGAAAGKARAGRGLEGGRPARVRGAVEPSRRAEGGAGRAAPGRRAGRARRRGESEPHAVGAAAAQGALCAGGSAGIPGPSASVRGQRRLRVGHVLGVGKEGRTEAGSRDLCAQGAEGWGPGGQPGSRGDRRNLAAAGGAEPAETGLGGPSSVWSHLPRLPPETQPAAGESAQRAGPFA